MKPSLFSSLCVWFQRPHKASGEEMTKYHSDDYIKFLRSIRPDNMSEYSKQMQRCEWLIYVSSGTHYVLLLSSSIKAICPVLSPTVNVGEDCPVFDGLFEFCQLSTGGSVGMFWPHFPYTLWCTVLHRKENMHDCVQVLFPRQWTNQGYRP